MSLISVMTHIFATYGLHFDKNMLRKQLFFFSYFVNFLKYFFLSKFPWLDKNSPTFSWLLGKILKFPAWKNFSKFSGFSNASGNPGTWFLGRSSPSLLVYHHTSTSTNKNFPKDSHPSLRSEKYFLLTLDLNFVILNLSAILSLNSW